MRKILFATMVFLSLCVSSAIVNADPVVESVDTDPAEPTPQSEITVTATITGVDIVSVNLTVSECRRDTGTCFIYTDYKMEQNQDGDWFAEARLLDDSGVSDYISYIFKINDDGVEYTLTGQWDVDLKIDSGNGGNGDNGGNGSPGFEIITVLAAIAIGILLIKRKRS